MNNKINIFEDYDSFTKFIRDILFYLDENKEFYTSKDIRIICTKENIEKFNTNMLEQMKSLGFTITDNIIVNTKETVLETSFGEFFNSFNHQDGHKIIFVEANPSTELFIGKYDFIVKLITNDGIAFLKRDDIFKILNYNND